jgi:hypothetical protein
MVKTATYPKLFRLAWLASDDIKGCDSLPES